MKKVTKQIPHDRMTCIKEMRWYLIRLIDTTEEVRKLAIVGLISDHLKHLAEGDEQV